MALSARCFSHAGDLKEASPRYLVRFLSRYAEFLKSRGLVLPNNNSECRLDYKTLNSILMAADPGLPRELVDSLHCIREMATPEAMSCLLVDAREHGIPMDDDIDLSPIDVALQIWHYDKTLVQYRHVEQYLMRPSTFVYFQSEKHSTAEFREPTPRIIETLERDLDRRFRNTKHGRGCCVFCYKREDGIWFLVWHGGPLKREGCIEHGEPSCICYRPEMHDVMVFQPATRELQIDANTKSEREIYRKLLGRHLFGDDHYFPGTAVYTLDPLLKYGEASLVCSDIPGIDWIKLRKIEFCWGGRIKNTEVFDSDDVFAAIRAGEVLIPSGARITEAWFEIKFSDSIAPRTIWIRPSNIIHYERDSDCEPVTDWLRKRCFVLLHLIWVFVFLHVLPFLQDADFLPDCLT